MFFGSRFWLGLAFIALGGCAEVELPEASLSPKNLMIKGNRLLQTGNFEAAASMFDHIGYNHPLSPEVPDALLKSAYASFKNNDFDVAKAVIDVFVTVYPCSPRASYALYLKGMCDFKRIREADYCQETAEHAKKTFQEVVHRFPSTSQAKAAMQKLRSLTVLANQHYFEIAKGAYDIGRPLAALHHLESLEGRGGLNNSEVRELKAKCLKACGLPAYLL